MSQNQASLAGLPPKMKTVKFLLDDLITLCFPFIVQVLADNTEQPCVGPG